MSLGMTVRELLERITSDEISEWAVFFQMENQDAKNQGDRDRMLGDIRSKLRGR